MRARSAPRSSASAQYTASEFGSLKGPRRAKTGFIFSPRGKRVSSFAFRFFPLSLFHLFNRSNFGVFSRAILGGLLLCGAFGAPSLVFGETESYEVFAKEVIDGDTTRLSDGTLVRYLGIDSPERRRRAGERWIYDPQPFAEEAAALNRELVEGKKIRLEVESRERSDRFGRVLAYVFVGEVFVNEKILEKGLAKRYRPSPQSKYFFSFKRAEEAAMEGRRGVWSQ